MKRPPIPFEDHPLATGRFIFPTASMAQTMTAIKKWLDIHIPGGIIFSYSRYGKSKTIKYIFEDPEKLWSRPLPMFQMISSNRLCKSDFYGRILRRIGQRHTSGKPESREGRVFESMMDAAEEFNSSKILLFIDNAEHLDTDQYGWLMDIYDDLDIQDIQLTTILIGDWRLQTKRSALRCNDDQKIRARFMTEENRFFGMQSAADLGLFLSSFDCGTPYPPNSKWTYTRFFVPDAYEAGFRMENQAEVIWNGILNYSMKNTGKGLMELAMQPLIPTLASLMRSLVDSDHVDLRITEALVEKATHFAIGNQIKFWVEQAYLGGNHKNNEAGK